MYFYSGIRSIKRTLNSVVFLDLKMNYDSVDSTNFYPFIKVTKVLLLQTYVCHHWFKSCLDLRKKRMFSKRFYLNSGIEHQTCRSIPQGTILGLLLFLKTSYERPAKLSFLQYVQNRTYVPTIRHEHSASNMCARFQFVHTWSVYRSSAEFSS